MVWIQVVLVVGLIGAVVIAVRRRRSPIHGASDIDTGTVSENWLAEQRRIKD